MKNQTVNQTFFVVAVHFNEQEMFLTYDHYYNTYTPTTERARAAQFNEQKDAEAVAHFFAMTAVKNSLDFKYELHREDLKTTIIELEKRDYLEGHGLEVHDEVEIHE